MMRQNILKFATPVVRSSVHVQQRTLAVTAVRMGEGDTGATRAGGMATSDSFNKREKANEDMFVKNQEREKLMKLREKIAAQQKHLKELDTHLDELSKSSGGEQH